jgi:hypothetical protein
MHLCLPFVALIIVLFPMQFLTSIAAIFHKIAAIISHNFNMMLSTPAMPQEAQHIMCLTYCSVAV